MKKILLFGISILIFGCAGVSITPLSQDEAAAIHRGDSKKNGYVIYEPLVVVEVSQIEVCIEKDSKGKCKKSVTRCSAGKPFVLPDYSKPYIIDIKSGFGKAGVELEFSDGWLLSKVKDNSDNTAVLGAVEKLLGLETKSSIGTDSASGCKDPGIYRVNISPSGIGLEQIKVY